MLANTTIIPTPLASTRLRNREEGEQGNAEGALALIRRALQPPDESVLLLVLGRKAPAVGGNRAAGDVLDVGVIRG
jgi:hypothetical protein